MTTKQNNCLIVCDGALSKKLLSRFTKLDEPRQQVIIACDGASEFLYANKMTPDYIIGDLDSVTPKTLAYYKHKKVTVKKVVNQNKNDLEKALDLALGKKFKNISIIGLTGKRFDHSINNISILKRYSRKADIRVYDNEFVMMVIHKAAKLQCKVGDIVSLIPLPEATGITTSGLKYPLKNESLIFGKREGALNEAIAENVGVKIKKGELLILLSLRA
jgi:thiamine pyrophosphokinase